MKTKPSLRRLSQGQCARHRLFCFPYAGGAASAFTRWPALLGTDVDVYSLSLPGRGERFREPHLYSLADILTSITADIDDLLDLPFALFGHSMGALIAFELARHLRLNNKRLPSVIFLSAAHPPHIPWQRQTYHLPEAEFIAELKLFNGIPGEIADHASALSFFIPMLRADFQACQVYKYEAGPPLPIPFHLFGGSKDPFVQPNSLAGWARHSTGECNVTVIQGDHFFINSLPPALFATVTTHLRRHCRA